MIISISVIVILYLVYRYFFKFYAIVDKMPQGLRNKLRRGKCPPSYPNGWYRLSRADELQPGVVHEAKFSGRHIVYYRGYDKIVYALHAYCPHMGANLGIGGQVKNTRCVECPFHGWRFDGKDGKLVSGDTYQPMKVTACEYHDIDNMTKEEKYIKCASKEGEVALKKYITREMNNLVYVWLHAIEVEPTYEPFEELLGNYELRGESINYVNCHIQEIPENGADMRHFQYLHYSVVDILPFIKFRWSMKTKNASDPDFYEYMVHPNKKVREYQGKLFHKHLESDQKRKKILNVLSLDAEILFFDRYSFYFLTTTGFQTGPATVSLYVRTMLFTAIFQQAIQPVDKMMLKVHHTIWMSKWAPYWLSAYVLYGELRQVVFDTLVWDRKIFSDKICYNLKSEADKALLNWRQWYAQFYEGAHEFEAKLDQLEW